MKKCLLVLITALVALGVNGQELDSLKIIERSKELFKILEVDLKFKDPYSYELLKIEALPVSLQEKLEFDISALKRAKTFLEIDTTSYLSDFTENKRIFEKQSRILSRGERLRNRDYEKYIMKYSENIDLHRQSLEALESHRNSIKMAEEDIMAKQLLLSKGSEDLSKTVQWRVSLDCYGANSYGNKILGRYIFRVSSEGSLEGNIIKTN